jgi:hypothetical protein
MNVILKLQWPLSATQDEAPILAYDQNRRHQKLLQPTHALADMFGGRPKIYVAATILAGDVTVLREIEAQPW